MPTTKMFTFMSDSCILPYMELSCDVLAYTTFSVAPFKY